MSTNLKGILWLMMIGALACGFLHHVVAPEISRSFTPFINVSFII